MLDSYYNRKGCEPGDTNRQSIELPTPLSMQFKPHHPTARHHGSAGAAFDVEGISKALQEDTSKKYTDDGLGLVETLKKRCVRGWV